METPLKKTQLVAITPPTVETPTKERRVPLKQLVNKLNFINFQNGTILVNFRHARFQRPLALRAIPVPCTGEILECRWEQPAPLKHKLDAHVFENLIIPDNKKLLIVAPELLQISEKGLQLRLPSFGLEYVTRRIRRHDCEGIEVQFIQNSALFSGKLINFNAVSFCVELQALPPQTFRWVTTELPATVSFFRLGEVLYSGECRILKGSGGTSSIGRFVLEPTSTSIQRFKPRIFRSTRHTLSPSPNLLCCHPLTGTTVDLKILDLSGSGFAVEEAEENALLLPGLILPEIELTFANSFRIRGKAQVIYRNVLEEDDRHRRVQCGLALLDMDIEEHVKLLGFLQQAKDGNTYVCNQVDLDSLWNFFFETGFIYPQKYAHIESNKDRLKDTYRKLYTESPDIARHFIYQDKGTIYGHMAMLRVHDRSWMIHHHAAGRGESNRAGLIVLSQISRYVNDIHNLYSAHLDYVFCYFRPDNKFPRRVFGGVAEFIDNQRACSVDAFAYFHFRRDLEQHWSLNGPWSLHKAGREDLQELESFYEFASGGLMIKTLDLSPDVADRESISREYQKLGFKKERHLYALKRGGTLVAILVISTSDVGLNMSDLTNCVKIIVLDPSQLPRETVNLLLSLISVKFEQQEIPVLVYPESYAKEQQLPQEKTYTLWALDLQYLDDYFKFCDTALRRI